MILDIFQYEFSTRALQAGILIGLITPFIGIFLVLRRYSLIADALSHVSLAGVAIGILAGINPIICAVATAIIASLGIEKLRTSKKIFGESALAIFLSGSLALAIILIGLNKGINVNLFNYLFGSILTVTLNDIYIILILTIIVFLFLSFFYKELVYITFDQEAAQVSGLPVKTMNFLLITLAALTIAMAIPVIGVLLISALIVIPVTAALQLKKNFLKTILWAELFSISSIILGIFISFNLNFPTSGTIILIAIIIFLVAYFYKNKSLKY